ncbi:MAG TPA: IS66 family transposase [Archangium sp.]|uniref:IS66 family transposase n=1 Tax=Archangium sp. TaxID=1872627 RepID=UPI002E373BEB|nr:IS66 family transposase [Archangium sp.]HEX5752316.1 IS66 family transposase [Archangium sp.]
MSGAAPDKKTMDVHGVAALLRALLAEDQDEQAIELVVGLLMQLVEKNTELELRLRKALRQHFGRRSEKLSAEQLSLFLARLGQEEAGVQDAAQPSAGEAGVAAGSTPPPHQEPRKKERTGHGRRPLPAHLPREQRVQQPPPEALRCEACGRDKSRCGEEKSETLEWVPGHFKVIEEVRPKYACRPCGDGLVVAPPADRVIEGGLPGPGLVAHVLVSKYKDHLPLHRLSGIYARHGVELRTSTLSDWVAAGADLLQPLAREVGQRALASHVLQSDDTHLKVLDREHPNGLKRGHMWVYLGDSTWAAFVYTPDWKQEGPLSFLEGREGWLLVDGYKGYDKLFTRPGATAVEVGCWSHARRYFVDALDAGDTRAALPLSLIGRLFAVEREADEQQVDEAERLRRRNALSRPVTEQLARWMADIYGRERPKSPLAQACRYAINQWTSLLRFLEDARLPLHNNASELRLREIAVGRKNYLFAGSDAGAERAACVYTLVATCVLAGVDPWAYLADVLDKLARGWPQRQLEQLLPPMWKAAREAAARTTPATSPAAT